jgi:hypothetical protein
MDEFSTSKSYQKVGKTSATPIDSYNISVNKSIDKENGLIKTKSHAVLRGSVTPNYVSSQATQAPRIMDKTNLSTKNANYSSFVNIKQIDSQKQNKTKPINIRPLDSNSNLLKATKSSKSKRNFI